MKDLGLPQVDFFDYVVEYSSYLHSNPYGAMQEQDTPVTVGFRGAGWTAGGLPSGTSAMVVPLVTADKATCTGVLYWKGSPQTAVCVMHPREFLATHYLIPSIINAGCAAWTQTPRTVGNDLRLEHETTLFDVTGGLAFLRQQGFKNIVLLGNSGGASLYTFYNRQAVSAPKDRLKKTPGGRPVDLENLEMPAPDGFIYVAPHPGQGKLLIRCIDPSVTDENDPLAGDASLDPFNTKNGFAPKGATYQAFFVERYRAAQRARVARLDARAKEMIDRHMGARRRAKDGGAPADHLLGAHTPVLTVWRTDADLRCWDLKLDPSERRYGSVWGSDPLASNYGAVGFARFCTLEAWLSTWSGITSRASMTETLKSVSQPSMMIEYSGDNTIFPSDIDALYSAIPGSDKQRHKIRGDHHGRPLKEGEPPGRVEAGQLVADWLKRRFAN